MKEIIEHGKTLHEAKRRIAELEAENAALREKARCSWTEMDPENFPGSYETQCGHAWVFIDGDAAFNGAKFCPYCSGEIEVAPTPNT